jgi:hypothetical protein
MIFCDVFLFMTRLNIMLGFRRLPSLHSTGGGSMKNPQVTIFAEQAGVEIRPYT